MILLLQTNWLYSSGQSVIAGYMELLYECTSLISVSFLYTFKSIRVRVLNTFVKKVFEYFSEYMYQVFKRIRLLYWILFRIFFKSKQKRNKILPYLKYSWSHYPIETFISHLVEMYWSLSLSMHHYLRIIN